MSLVWTYEAISDRRAIYDYLETENPLAALSMDDLFSEQAQLLLEHPGLGRPGRVPGTREWVSHQNYLLIYDLRGNVVRILRVLHAARKWPPD